MAGTPVGGRFKPGRSCPAVRGGQDVLEEAGAEGHAAFRWDFW
jgi:hypothetical protein